MATTEAADGDAQAPPGSRGAPDTSPSALNRILLVVITGSLMSVLDMTIVNVALRDLSHAFGAPLETIQWTATAYTLALAAVVPTAPWTMARIGAKRAYLTALVLFTLGSLLAACAWDAPSLIAFRVVQGLGGGLLMPVGMGMAMAAADRERFGRTMALLGLPVLVGPVAGPVLGGRLLDSLSWQWIFLVNVPVGALALVLAVRLLRPDAPRGTAPAPGLDVPGLLMLSPGLALLLYGLARGGERGEFATPGVLLPALLGAALMAGFVRRSLTVRHPLLDLHLLRDRTFAVGIGTLALFTCGYFGSMLLGPVYWQQVRGWSATATGLLGVPVGLAVGTTMQIASRRVDKVSPRHLILTGIVVGAAGMALTGLLIGVEDVPAWQPVSASVLMGIGAGMSLMPTTTTASRDLPRDRMAAAGTALSINAQVCASVGTALVSVVLGSAGQDPAGFRTSYLVAAALLTLALIPATRLPTGRT
ncbi:DHA2 family efflux MFS transporter permease subunit [Streptomyces sp. A012304]|uniref:DHA2 family efflux MFS transporter permease subunit n=1 Tax=Streptomyces sp. A012304 TaxID=375446 RepID=UPI002230DFD9|nr:DHA2 family efflux MFS transporter permease subunit [Streptomyces sp. A012304]GKQ37085.1 MFS transporter [Streptomyces sp. A012304]